MTTEVQVLPGVIATEKAVLCSGCGARISGLYAEVVTRGRVSEDIRLHDSTLFFNFTDKPDVCSQRCLREVLGAWPKLPWRKDLGDVIQFRVSDPSLPKFPPGEVIMSGEQR